MATDLITEACDRATLVSACYITNELGLTHEFDYGLLSGFLREECKKDLPQAIEDAKTAINANMGQVASATLEASIKLIGIHAGQRYTDHQRIEATR